MEDMTIFMTHANADAALEVKGGSTTSNRLSQNEVPAQALVACRGAVSGSGR